MRTSGVRQFFAAVLLLGLQACDVVNDTTSQPADSVGDGTTSLKLQAPALLLQDRAIDLALIDVEVVVAYTVGTTDYRFSDLASRTGSESGAYWLAGINVPAEVPFTLSMTWFEETPRLELLRITRQFEGQSQRGQTEFVYEFSATNEFSDEPDATDYAGFDSDGDSVTNIKERQDGTDPFNDSDPLNPDPGSLQVEPAALELQAAVFDSSTTTLELNNLFATATRFTLASDVDWLTASPDSASIPANTRFDLSVGYTCTAEPGTRTGTLTILTASRETRVPVELNCSEVPAPLLSGATPELRLSALVAASTTGTVQFRNSGNALLDYTLSSDSDWLVPQNTRGELVPGGTERVELNVVCGAAAETRTGRLTIGGNGGEATVTVDLVCSIPPSARIEVIPTILDLTALTDAQASSSFTVQNVGTAELEFTVESTAQWLTTTTSEGRLAPGSSTSVVVSGSCSSESGSRSASLTVDSNGGNVSISSTLTCTAIPTAVLGDLPATLTLEAQADQSTSSTVQLSNVGNALLTYQVSSNSSWLTASRGNGAISPEQSASLGIQAQCDSITANRSGTLTIDSNGGTREIDVSLECTPAPRPLLGNVTPSVSLSAAVNTAASGSLSFDNLGDAPLSYTLASNAGWLSISSVTQSTVAPGQSASATLAATCDSEVKKLEGIVSITSNGGEDTVNVSLDCRGPVLNGVRPLSFSFTAIVSQADQGSLVFTNSGNEALTFTVSTDSDWLCTSDAGAAGCDSEDDSVSGELPAGNSFELSVVATCPGSAGQYAGALRLSGNVDSLSIPVSLICAPAPLAAAEPSLSYVNAKTYRFDWQDVPEATYYQLLENADGESQFRIVSEGIQPGLQRYDHIVPLHLRDRASYILETCNERECVESSVVSVRGNLVEAIGYIPGEDDSGFGQALDVSGDGKTLAVFHGQEGAVSIFRKATSSDGQFDWIQDGTLDFAPFLGTNSFSQYSVSLNEAGDLLAVGLPDAPKNACECYSGTVHLYERQLLFDAFSLSAVNLTYQWVLIAELFNPQASEGDDFGRSVSLNGPGSRVMIGSPGSNEVYEFAAGDQWKPINTIYPVDIETYGFGTYLQLSADKGTLVVSATAYDNDYGNDVVFVFTGNSDNWTQEAMLYLNNDDSDFCYEGSSCGDGFGSSLSVSGDGETVAIGAPFDASNASGVNGDQTDNSLSNAGAAYVYSRSGGLWPQQAYIKASNPADYDYFGYSLDLTYDGRLLAIGAWEEASSALGFGGDETADIFAGIGAGYLFSNDGNSWRQVNYFKASQETINLGEAIRISSDGADLIISSSYNDELYYY
ncbi:MAG: hypothetical protein HKN42_14800 [Granulosicoccus sp.]|nr:hypothetical protein [Granulosicoccus sp.]